MEVLTAYVRQHASYETTTDCTPDPEIRAIMTVLRRRTRSFGYGESEPLDLHATILSGVDLWGANLWGANLSGMDLSEAIIRGANLAGADLREAHVTPAQLEEANGDENTKLSSPLKSPAHWGVKTDEQPEGG
jgi:uncharacterized protein YjbI with pentapeptide repeats